MTEHRKNGNECAEVHTLRSAFVAALLASVLAASFAQRASAQARPTAADEAAIAEFNRRYLQAINDGDIDTLASLTTEGHMMISSGGAPLAGKKALVDAMTRAFQTTDFDEIVGAARDRGVRRPRVSARHVRRRVQTEGRRRRSRASPATSCASTARSTALGSWCATRSTANSRAIASERVTRHTAASSMWLKGDAMSTARFVTVVARRVGSRASPLATVPRKIRRPLRKRRPLQRSAKPAPSTGSAKRAGPRRLRPARRHRASSSTRAGRSRCRTIGESARSAASPSTRTTTFGSITAREPWTRARPARCRASRRTTQGVPISGLGHPRPYADRSTGCCVPAPSVLKFDREGNLLSAVGRTFRSGLSRGQAAARRPAVLAGARARHLRGRQRLRVPCGNGEDGGARQQQNSRRIRGRLLTAATTRIS